MDATAKPARGGVDEQRTEPGRVSVRNSRDGDVPAMLAIYLHHIRRGVDPGVDGDFEAPTPKTSNAAAAR